MTQPFDSGPGPRHPELDALIRAARAQSAPVVTVQVEDIRAAASTRRAVRWAGGLAAAVVLAISLWAVQGRAPGQTAESTGGSPRVVLADDPAAPAPAAVVPDARPVHASPASGGSIEPLEGAQEPESDQAGVVALAGGRYRIQTTESAMLVSVVGRVLEISAASEVVVDAGVEHRTFRVVTGSASWSKSKASPAEPKPEPGPGPGPDATLLASHAEAALLSGRAQEAVRLLRQLVQAHPRGATTKAALIDLARLEKRLGRPERAHCAYALFSKRFPTDARTPTVRRADDALGLAPRCRGLRPLSN